MHLNSNESALIGQKVQWRMNQNDTWKSATIMGTDDYAIVTFGEHREENVYCFRQTKVLLEFADLEYIYCTTDDGRRFRGYAIREAIIHPVQDSQRPKWSEPQYAVSDLPAAVINGCAYAIDQFKKADDKSEFSRERPDLRPALAMMFQPQ